MADTKGPNSIEEHPDTIVSQGTAWVKTVAGERVFYNPKDLSLHDEKNTWRAYTDRKTGKPYYFNKLTQQTEWKLPSLSSSNKQESPKANSVLNQSLSYIEHIPIDKHRSENFIEDFPSEGKPPSAPLPRGTDVSIPVFELSHSKSHHYAEEESEPKVQQYSPPPVLETGSTAPLYSSFDFSPTRTTPVTVLSDNEDVKVDHHSNVNHNQVKPDEHIRALELSVEKRRRELHLKKREQLRAKAASEKERREREERLRKDVEEKERDEQARKERLEKLKQQVMLSRKQLETDTQRKKVREEKLKFELEQSLGSTPSVQHTKDDVREKEKQEREQIAQQYSQIVARRAAQVKKALLTEGWEGMLSPRCKSPSTPRMTLAEKAREEKARNIEKMLLEQAELSRMECRNPFPFQKVGKSPKKEPVESPRVTTAPSDGTKEPPQYKPKTPQAVRSLTPQRTPKRTPSVERPSSAKRSSSRKPKNHSFTFTPPKAKPAPSIETPYSLQTPTPSVHSHVPYTGTVAPPAPVPTYHTMIPFQSSTAPPVSQFQFSTYLQQLEQAQNEYPHQIQPSQQHQNQHSIYSESPSILHSYKDGNNEHTFALEKERKENNSDGYLYTNSSPDPLSANQPLSFPTSSYSPSPPLYQPSPSAISYSPLPTFNPPSVPVWAPAQPSFSPPAVQVSAPVSAPAAHFPEYRDLSTINIPARTQTPSVSSFESRTPTPHNPGVHHIDQGILSQTPHVEQPAFEWKREAWPREQNPAQPPAQATPSNADSGTRSSSRQRTRPNSPGRVSPESRPSASFVSKVDRSLVWPGTLPHSRNAHFSPIPTAKSVTEIQGNPGPGHYHSR